MNASDVSVTDLLLADLRRAVGDETLSWAAPPERLYGGFWAEMYRIELAGAPVDLTGRLVARIMPDPDAAAFETAVQRHVHRHGYAVPAVLATGGPGGELGRAWTVMEHAPGRPALDGLSAMAAVRQVPSLARRLPDVLAHAAAALHRCPVDVPELAERADITAFLARVAVTAEDSGRVDLSRVAQHLAERAPTGRVICHGDLHPFNVLVDGDRWTVLDWTTATLADPHHDLGFTTLMLSHPPLGGPAPVRVATRWIGHLVAERFLTTYRRLSGREIDRDHLAWGQRVHALRALTEVAAWRAQGLVQHHRGHPWSTMLPVLEAQLAPIIGRAGVRETE
jgi:aminoglycoside phosphotransferase (APT) family kinase protein